ncbi:MAG: ATP-dependent helicase [Spirochaetes bacterium]|nr:ATP-dependent helicase [Spirochaetota bacterium]
MLNNEQKKAAKFTEGISVVIAGAGSGKTKTLVKRIENTLCEGKVKPEEILILTFSKKAAEEIRERSAKEIADADKITAGTFHSLCYRILSENPKLLFEKNGIRNFSIMSEDDEEKLLTDMVASRIDNFMGLSAKTVFYLLKNLHRMEESRLKALHDLGIVRELECIKTDFELHKKERSLLTFSDLILCANSILSDNNDFREMMRKRFKYIFVDEFQDTSDDNFLLLKNLLPDDKPNLFAVGDDWQSIYGFRDANIDYMIRPHKYFRSVSRYFLTVNYRSRREIIRISQKAIKRNKNRTSKRIKSASGKGGKIVFKHYDSWRDEIETVKSILTGKDKGTSCILYRSNYYGDRIKKQIGSNENILFSTIHGSKGLEYDNVILCGVEDGVFPCAFNSLEEERRLLYVALSRAKEKLYILHKRTESLKPLFIRELS